VKFNHVTYAGYHSDDEHACRAIHTSAASAMSAALFMCEDSCTSAAVLVALGEATRNPSADVDVQVRRFIYTSGSVLKCLASRSQRYVHGELPCCLRCHHGLVARVFGSSH
jgi:hypothetical protein